jgi:hypothetical protein
MTPLGADSYEESSFQPHSLHSLHAFANIVHRMNVTVVYVHREFSHVSVCCSFLSLFLCRNVYQGIKNVVLLQRTLVLSRRELVMKFGVNLGKVNLCSKARAKKVRSEQIALYKAYKNLLFYIY